jgi:hypothetical protein
VDRRCLKPRFAGHFSLIIWIFEPMDPQNSIAIQAIRGLLEREKHHWSSRELLHGFIRLAGSDNTVNISYTAALLAAAMLNPLLPGARGLANHVLQDSILEFMRATNHTLHVPNFENFDPSKFWAITALDAKALAGPEPRRSGAASPARDHGQAKADGETGTRHGSAGSRKGSSTSWASRSDECTLERRVKPAWPCARQRRASSAWWKRSTR